jgi:hypothetical protein
MQSPESLESSAVGRLFPRAWMTLFADLPAAGEPKARGSDPQSDDGEEECRCGRPNDNCRWE